MCRSCSSAATARSPRRSSKPLVDGRIDLAVHSLKDLPTFAVPGVVLAAVPPRGPTGDALVSLKHRSFDALPAGAVVATSSLHRKAQLLYRRPDLKLVDIRGNVETRLRKLAEQNLDATVLAEAGLHRLGPGGSDYGNPRWRVDAPRGWPGGDRHRVPHGQRAAAHDPRIDRPSLDPPRRRSRAHHAAQTGRRLQRADRQRHSTVANGTLTLRGVVLSPDGARRIDAAIRGPMSDAERLGVELARQLRGQGADELLGK